MAQHLLWTPTAETFSHHHLAHVMNFWKLGHPAKFHLNVKPGGTDDLVLTFQLPSLSQPIPPLYVEPELVPHPPSSEGRSSDCLKKANFSRVKRRLRRAAERTAAAAEKNAAKKEAAEMTVAKNEPAEKAVAEKEAAERTVAEKEAAAKTVADKEVDNVVTENEAAEKVAAAEKDAAKKEFAEKEVATASTSCCGSEQQASLACWICHKMFTVDDQG